MSNPKKKLTVPPGDLLFAFCAAALVALAALLARLAERYTSLGFWPAFVILLLLAALGYLTVRAVLYRRETEEKEERTQEKTTIFELVRLFRRPALLCDPAGTVLWSNDDLNSLLHTGSVCGAHLGEFLPDARQLLSRPDTDGIEITVGDKTFLAGTYTVVSGGKVFILVLFDDITSLRSVEKAYRDEQPSVMYIRIDNLEEMQQYLQDDYRTVEAKTNAVIKQWAAGMSGVLREYERNKYLLFVSAADLENCIKNKFSVLDEIREIRVPETGASITASIGAARCSGTLAEREAAAAEAQKHALERGGDQAVVRTETSGTLYFGGVSQTAHKVTKVRARVFANEVCSRISSSDNVLICAHRHIDFDAFGSAVGMARFVFFCGVKCNIIVDRTDPTVKLCLSRLEGLPEYENVFIDEDEALELITSRTLMIITDVNNPKLFEAPRAVAAVGKKIFIDHHRKVLDFESDPDTETYIEVSASSASELVAEMIEQSLPPRTLLRQEAELLLAGIQLDTKRFTKATGPRTFGAALYLRNAGANPEETRSLFDTDISAMKAEATFETGAAVYAKHPNVAIAVSDQADALAAARVADKLLELRGVDASFTLVSVGDTIHISGRSNGKVNVQHILETLGGGGRFEEAGAQVRETDLQGAAVSLRDAIDAYFDELAEKRVNN